MCCAMYSSKRFKANKAAINQSCRFMYITSSLSEGEKDLLPPKSEGSNRHRQAVPAPNNICRVQTPSALRLSQQSNMRSVAGCFQGHEKRDSTIIQINPAVVKPFLQKRQSVQRIPLPKPKTSLRGNRRRSCKKSCKLNRRLPRREVRGWERGLGRGRTPPKGVRPLPKVFPVQPRFAPYAIALIFLVNWLFL